MSLKKVLDAITKNNIEETKWRIEMWKSQIQNKKKLIKEIREEIKKYKKDLIIENELLKKYEEIDFDEILNKQIITTNDEIELLKKTHIPKE